MDELRRALEQFDATERSLAYWQAGSGHRDRLRKDLRNLHGSDYAANTDARVTAIVQEALRDFIANAALRAALAARSEPPVDTKDTPRDVSGQTTPGVRSEPGAEYMAGFNDATEIYRARSEPGAEGPDDGYGERIYDPSRSEPGAEGLRVPCAVCDGRGWLPADVHAERINALATPAADSRGLREVAESLDKRQRDHKRRGNRTCWLCGQSPHRPGCEVGMAQAALTDPDPAP